MHGKIAAGKLTDISFDDDNKRIEVAAKIVDDDEWAKVREGVYSGFSQGGRDVKRWPDAETGLVRYTADPNEISLVDLPCLPDATFEVVKAGAFVEKRAFANMGQPAAPSPVTIEKHLQVARERAENLTTAQAKTADMVKQNDVMAREILNGLDAIVKASPQYAARIAKCGRIDNEPMPAKAALRAVAKDAATVAAEEETRVSKMTPEQRSLELMKRALSNPTAIRLPVKDADDNK